MGYVKANDILPYDIICEIQKYVDGEIIYIPRKENKRVEWGTKTGVKVSLAKRNRAIYKDYQSGLSFERLSEKYYLVPNSIKRIVLQEKNSK